MASSKREQAPALQSRLSPARREDNEEEEEERSLDPGEAHGAHKPRSATRRATMRRGRESRVAPLGMTNHESQVTGRDSRNTGQESRLPPAGKQKAATTHPSERRPRLGRGRYREERAVSLAWGTDFCWRRTWKRSPMPSGKMRVLSCRRARTRSVSSMPSSKRSAN